MTQLKNSRLPVEIANSGFDRPKPKIELIKTFPPLHQWKFGTANTCSGQVAMRIIKINQNYFFDIREHVEADKVNGFTRRGFRLTLEQAEKLASSLPAIVRELHAEILMANSIQEKGDPADAS